MNLQEELKDLFNAYPTLQRKFSQTFFYANLCQVCHTHNKEKSLKRCSRCKMIYYCSSIHQTEHWSAHREFCKAATELQKSVIGSSFFSALGEFNVDDQWTWKMAIISIMENHLKRKLILFEKEMLLYPKVCLVCKETNVNLLTSCPDCPHANFCKNHLNCHIKNENCLLYSFSCLMDCRSLLPMKSTENKILRNISSLMPFKKDRETLLPSMADFVSYFYRFYSKIQPKREVILAQLSDYFTQPLTLFHAFKKLNYLDKKEIVLHVIGASLPELENCLAWDILLHWMPKLELLTLVFVGPDCQTTKSISAACRRCTDRKMNVQVCCFEGYYMHFYESHLFKKPDVIVGFHLDFVNGDAWKESLLLLSKIKCPLVLTSYSMRKMEKGRKRLCEFFDKSVSYMCAEYNPFKGYNTHRDPESDAFLHKNGFVAIYKEFWENDSDAN